ncbi:hypothetical protein ACW9HW_00210 [Pseudomonas sp. SDO5532_S415]
MSEKELFPLPPENRDFKRSVELSSSVEDPLTVVPMVANTQSWADTSATRAMAVAKSWEESPTAKAMAAAVRSWEDNPTAKAMAAAVRSWEDNPTAKAMAAAVRSWEESPAMKAMAASTAWKGNSAFKAAIAAVKSLEAYPRMRELAGPTLTLATWGFSGEVTVDAVLEELATRTNTPFEQTAEEPNELLQKGERRSPLELADVSSVDVASDPASNQSLNGIPTWILLFWLYIVAPLVFVMVNWESARVGLADLNARLPQTESLAEIRKFIRTEIAGKPSDVRLVKGKNVRLRERPGMKADVILLLPPDAIVVVLGKEDRNWLYVSYEHQGYMIDGYLSTKFLKKVRK